MVDERRGDESGRREEDRRWEKVQEQVMNLVTSLRTNQVAMEGLEKEVAKLGDHVEDVDDHLRGVGGRESLDTRVTVMEKDVFQHGVLLQQIAKHFGSLETLVAEIKADLSTIKLHRTILKETEATRMDRLREWLKFWGPIILATLALIVPLAKMVFESLDKVTFFAGNVQYRPDERLRKQIEADKRSARGKAVRKRLADLEQATTNYRP